jgi:predicted nucleic acid-binding protein
VNLVDSCGWLEYFADGPNAGFFAKPIEKMDKLLVPTICILEVFKRVYQQSGEGAALQAIAAMSQGNVVEMGAAIAMTAAKIGVEMKIPLADSVILATARARGATVWTQDEHFRNIAGVKFVEKK